MILNINLKHPKMFDKTNKLHLFLASFGVFLCSTATTIIIPIYVESFKNGSKQSNPYFVLFISTFFFTVFYMSYGFLKFGKQMFVKLEFQWYFFLVGILCALYELLVIYSGPASRVPPNLRGILTQLMIPITFLCSWLIKKENLIKTQIIGSIIVSIGVVISLIPIIISLISNDMQFTFDNLVWCFILIMGYFGGALVNIYEDYLFKKFQEINMFILLAWSCLYQFLLICALFWFDFVPWFGISKSIDDWYGDFIYGFQCSFDMNVCKNTWFLMIIYFAISIAFYFAIITVLKYISANYYILLMSIVSPFSVTFWIIFPELSNVINSTINIVFNYIAVIIVLIGIIIYVKDAEPLLSFDNDSNV